MRRKKPHKRKNSPPSPPSIKEKRKRYRIGSPPHKEECQKVIARMKKLVQDYRMVFLPLGRKNAQGIDEMLPLYMEIISDVSETYSTS